jgi:hypothetical protein
MVVSLKQVGTTAWNRDRSKMFSTHSKDAAKDAIWADGFVSIHSI